MNVAEIPTPALLLDAAGLEANLGRMAECVAASGRNLRPHAKAHKCVEIARRQIAAGAIGVCAATVSEAELMVRAGIPGVLLTSPIADPGKCLRMAALPGVSVVVDHPAQVSMYAEAAQRAGTTLRVLVDIDVGDHRTGVAAGEAAAHLAETIASHPRLQFCGLQGYSVRGSHMEGTQDRAQNSADALEGVRLTAELLAQRGVPVPIMTGGSTGSHASDLALPWMTEVQAGSYALMDVAYARIGIDYRHAITVLGTIISANHEDRVTVDAGYKAFSTDRPFGPEMTGGRYQWAGDEFGYVFPDGTTPFPLGSRVRFLPPHCDPTVNLYDRFYVCRGEEVVDVWPIMGRMI